MKRMILRICGLALAMALACCAGWGALAEAKDVFYISVDHCVRGGEYLLMLCDEGVNPRDITSEDILFIDQLSANSAGRIDAAIVFPGFTRCTAVVGGTFSDGSESPKRLGDYASSVLPGQLNTLEDAALEGTAFTHIYLGESVSSVGARAFADCGQLMYVYIPASVRSIASDAFDGCEGVTIGCKAGSAAHDFALETGIAFVLLND